MHYLVSANEKLKSDKYQMCSIQDCLDYFKDKTIIGCDTETKGFDPHTKELLLVQLGDEENQYAIDITTIDIRLFKDLFENKKKTFIFHNAKFDLKFFIHQRIIIRNVFDTFLAESLLWLGYPPGLHHKDLASCCQQYLGIYLDKSVRGEIIWMGLTDKVVTYGCNDVKYLIPLARKQIEELKKKNMLTAMELENKFVLVLALIEYNGVKIDSDKWTIKMQHDIEACNEARAALNNWVVTNCDDPRFVSSVKQLDLFDVAANSSGKICSINWASPNQVVEFLEHLGFDLIVLDKETKEKKKSVEAKRIKKQLYVSSVAPLYINFKKKEKIVSTYGQSWLNSINDNTHRIHTSFNQLLDTARISSGGGKDKDNKNKKLPNFQNLPKTAETRACFVAEPGFKWISADYKGQESVLMANISQDQKMIEVYTSGNGDIHSLVAKTIFVEELKDIPIEKVKELAPKKRDQAKPVEFGINYGGDAHTVAENLGVPLSEGVRIYNAFMDMFSGIKRYFAFCREDVMQKGYILLSPLTGHRAHIYDFEHLKEIENLMNNPVWWEHYLLDKQARRTTEYTELVDHYRRRRKDSEKQSINYRMK